MADKVRIAPLLWVCLEVLRDSTRPLPRSEVMDLVEQRVVLSAYERATFDDTGRLRWRNVLGWAAGDAATIGWMSKRGGEWSITEAGVSALETLEADVLHEELRRRYAKVRQLRARAVEDLVGVEGFIARALGVVDPGTWTAHEDLALIVGTSADQIAHFLAGSQKAVPGAHRMLHADGSLLDEGMLHMAHRSMNVMEKLIAEGIEFDGKGRASQEQRMTVESIEERLSDLGGEEPAQPATRRAWLVRGSSVDGEDMVRQWIDAEFVSLAATKLRRVSPPLPHRTLKSIVDADYQHTSYAARETKFNEFDAFCNGMREGDYLLTTSQGEVFLGRITGGATYLKSPDQRSNLRRSTEWINAGNPILAAELPQPLPAKLAGLSDVVELTESLATIEQLLADAGVEITEPAPKVQRELSLPNADDKLADELLMEVPWLQEVVDLLWARKQVIFYGPPGTGKTYLAMKLARFLAESNAVKLVQFHAAYTYEDFFEGFRPTDDNGSLKFARHQGPFRRLVEDARLHPADPYILVIDEINRANLASVFGELYFLLEYREEPISLLYSEESNFTLPPNVFIIGTMNTTDRSIAAVDAAIRRRFAFVELHPNEKPVSGLLRRWIDREDLDSEAADLLDTLNDEIAEWDLKLGPSYFMRPEVFQDGGLARVWRTSVLPLLEEHFLSGQTDVRARFGFDTIRKRARGR